MLKRFQYWVPSFVSIALLLAVGCQPRHDNEQGDFQWPPSNYGKPTGGTHLLWTIQQTQAAVDACVAANTPYWADSNQEASIRLQCRNQINLLSMQMSYDEYLSRL